MVLKENLLVYEDENCKVSYNLWNEGGNIGFQFFNKKDKNIYLNLEESFFILNGVSYNYYRNRVFTNSTRSGTLASRGRTASKSVTGINYLDLLQTNTITATNTVELMSSSGFSVSFNEEKICCIPSKTSKIISEYNINEKLFSDCSLFKYPSRNKIKIGSSVQIVQKQDQRSGNLTQGIVKRILTSSSSHPHGIKVELDNGKIGRVQSLG